MPDEVKATAPVERRVAALEQAFEERNLIPGHLAHIAREHWVPANGAKVVARAWTDPDLKRRFLENGKTAVIEPGFTKPEHHKHVRAGKHAEPAERDLLHALLVHGVHDHRAAAGLVQGFRVPLGGRAAVATVLRERGSICGTRSKSRCGTPPPTRAKWYRRCSRPKTVGWREDKLTEIVTKESMIGVARLEAPYG